jgi:hypothetical protein
MAVKNYEKKSTAAAGLSQPLVLRVCVPWARIHRLSLSQSIRILLSYFTVGFV